MSVNKYLPSPSEYADKLSATLAPFEARLYVVGSAARKQLYGLSIAPAGYDFVFNENDFDLATPLVDALEVAFPGKVKVDGDVGYIYVDCETFNATFYIGAVDTFLRTVRFAGDGLAVYVPDGRPIVLPEYMTMPPVVQIIKIKDTDAQANKEWLSGHLVSLTKFQDELYRAVNSELDKKQNEPAQAATD